jgi:hypothetical protein
MLVLLIASTVSLAASASTAADTSQTDSTETGIRIGRGGAQMRLELMLPSRVQLLQLGGAYAVPSVHQSPKFSPALALELDVGSLVQRQSRHSVTPIEGSSITVAALVPSVGFRDTSRVALEGWRFGFRLASGHRLSSQSKGGLYLLHAGGWTWSYVRPRPAAGGDSTTAFEALATAEAYRTSHFGANTSATIGYHFGDGLTAELGYQRVLLYKNHVVFPWLGSLLVEGLAQSAVGIALRGAEQRNARAAAIATLILRSALSWGIYELRRTAGQHFPFGGSTPMLWDEFRLRVGLAF